MKEKEERITIISPPPKEGKRRQKNKGKGKPNMKERNFMDIAFEIIEYFVIILFKAYADLIISRR
jgi:hypothetical protein